MATFIKQSFDRLLPDAQQAEPWYVCLLCDVPYYGGPEEGGWWGTDTHTVAARQCFNKEEAERYALQVKALAKRLSSDARKAHGDHCLRSLEWLEERGLDADFLPEPDGEESYYVVVSQGIPEPSYGSRRYE